MLYLGNKKLPLNMNTVERVANRLKREIILRGPFRRLVEYRHDAELAAYAPQLPKLSESDARFVRELKQNGVLQRPIGDLGIHGTDVMVAGLETLVSELKTMPTGGSNAPRLPISRLLEIPEIYRWGLDDRLLDIVENYIGLPAHYHGADLRREIADGATTDVRQWHIDAEDHRMFKIIAYLDHDVNEVGGPFEYMTREVTLRAARRLHYVSGFVTDARMQKAVPVTEWRMATGPVHSANIADTCAVFHRAKPPTTLTRYSVTFSWTSRKAMKTYASMPMTEETHEAILARLSPRQRACVPPRTPPA
jgi:hypothetical protein